MYKKSIKLAVATGMLLAFLTGCTNPSNQLQSVEGDILLDVPDVTIKDDNKETTGNYAEKEVVNGFWVKEMTFGNEKIYSYVPLMSKKTDGIFDFEDAEEISITAMNKYLSYNCPNGATIAKLKAKQTCMSYRTNPCLGRNTNKNYEQVNKTEPVCQRESFSLSLDNSTKESTLCNYDVGCITFALYKDLYEKYPEIKLQVYGIDSAYSESNVGDINSCDVKIYAEFLKNCKNSGYSDCTFLGERVITQSDIFYIDYRALAKKGVALNKNFNQYLLVLNVSEISGFAYYMDKNGCYNIEDESKYEEWKSMHLNQFIAE